MNKQNDGAMLDRAIAPLEELARVIEKWRNEKQFEDWGGAERGAAMRSCASELSSLLPALTSRFEALEEEVEASGADRKALLAEIAALKEPMACDVEALSAKFHDIYQQEAKRQGDVRHKDAYADLAENIKEFDRILARYVLAQLRLERAAALREAKTDIEEEYDDLARREVSATINAPDMRRMMQGLGIARNIVDALISDSDRSELDAHDAEFGEKLLNMADVGCHAKHPAANCKVCSAWELVRKLRGSK